MVRTDLNDITDEEFQTIIIPFDDIIYEHVRSNILNEFVAFFFATGFNKSAIWRESVRGIINSACEYLSGYNIKDCDYQKIKSILESKYKLKITNDDILEIEEI